MMSPIGKQVLTRINQNRRASILMEALLTVAILSVSLTVIVQGIMAAYRASRMGWRYSEAALALDSAMTERIFRGGVASGIDETGDLEKPFQSYDYRLVSSPAFLNQSINPRLNDVVLSVAWQDGAKAHSISAQTFLFNSTPPKDSGETP